MSVIEIRRVGVDPTQNVWDLSIYGDPSVAPGFAIGIGSRAVQYDSSPVGVVWAKTGADPTAWTKVFIDGTARPITVADLPSNFNIPVERNLLDLLNPVVAGALDRSGDALRDGTIEDFRFALTSALQ